MNTVRRQTPNGFQCNVSRNSYGKRANRERERDRERERETERETERSRERERERDPTDAGAHSRCCWRCCGSSGDLVSNGCGTGESRLGFGDRSESLHLASAPATRPPRLPKVSRVRCRS